jgi:hypothetical protein
LIYERQQADPSTALVHRQVGIHMRSDESVAA